MELRIKTLLYYSLHWSSGMNWEVGGAGGIPERIKHNLTFPPIWFPTPPKSAGLASWNALWHGSERQVLWYAGVLLRVSDWPAVKCRSTLHGHRGLLLYPVSLSCVASRRLDLRFVLTKFLFKYARSVNKTD